MEKTRWGVPVAAYGDGGAFPGKLKGKAVTGARGP